MRIDNTELYLHYQLLRLANPAISQLKMLALIDKKDNWDAFMSKYKFALNNDSNIDKKRALSELNKFVKKWRSKNEKKM